MRCACHAARVTECAVPAMPPEDGALCRHAAWPPGSERGPELGVGRARRAGDVAAPCGASGRDDDSAEGRAAPAELAVTKNTGTLWT